MEVPQMRVILAVLALVSSTVPAFADQVVGTILAFDRVDHIIVLDDKTIWTIAADFVLPDGLAAGDSITIDFQGAAENGIGKILTIARN